MSDGGYQLIPPEFQQALKSLSVARAFIDSNDTEGAKNKLKQAIQLLNHCDSDEAKEKANQAQQILNSLG